MPVVIADISNAHEHSERYALEYVRNFCAAEGVDLGRVTVVSKPEHAWLAKECPPSTNWLVAQPGRAVEVVTQRIRSLENTGASVMLLTFTSQVKALARQYWQGVRVDSKNLLEFSGRDRVRPYGSAPRVDPSTLPRVTPSQEEPPWAFDHLSTLDQALETLLEVLREQNAYEATPVRQTQLRPWMGWRNATFAGNAESTRSAGMVTTVLRIAATRGLISLAGTHPSDLYVWLNAQDPHKQEDAPVPTEIVPAESAALVLSRAEHQPSSDERSLSKAASDPTTVKNDVPARPKQKRDPSKFRPHKYSQAIIDDRMGPFPVARPTVYEALVQLDLRHPRLQVHVFVSAAVKVALVKHPDIVLMRRQLEQATLQQMLRAGVALDEQDRPLPNHWRSGVAVVHRLAPDAVRRMEAEILISLFTALEVTGADVEDIARCLYGTADDPTNVLKVHDLIKFLTDDGRVYEDKRGVFRVKESDGRSVEQHGAVQPEPGQQPASAPEDEDDLRSEDSDDSVH